MTQKVSYSIITPASGDLLLLTEVKTFLGIDHNDTDEMVKSMISVAVNAAELYTGKVFEQRTILGKYDNLLIGKYDYPHLVLQRSPVISIDEVSAYIDADWVTILSTNYSLVESVNYPDLVFLETPLVDEGIFYPLKVEFTAGYAETPAEIIHGIKAHVAYLYENRGDIASDISAALPDQSKIFYSAHRLLKYV